MHCYHFIEVRSNFLASRSWFAVNPYLPNRDFKKGQKILHLINAFGIKVMLLGQPNRNRRVKRKGAYPHNPCDPNSVEWLFWRESTSACVPRIEEDEMMMMMVMIILKVLKVISIYLLNIAMCRYGASSLLSMSINSHHLAKFDING